MNCGFIRKYVPFGYKPKNCVYQLIDNYALFYYRFIKDNNQNNEYWQDISNTQRVYTWSGNVFDRVCLERIAQIKSALGIRGVYTEVNSW